MARDGTDGWAPFVKLARYYKQENDLSDQVPCHRGGHACRWPACPADCDGRPGRIEKLAARHLTKDEQTILHSALRQSVTIGARGARK